MWGYFIQSSQVPLPWIHRPGLHSKKKQRGKKEGKGEVARSY